MNWPHAPAHWLFEPGLYMVTAGTHQKLPHLNTPERLDFFLESLFARAAEFGWELRRGQCWPIIIISSPSRRPIRPTCGNSSANSTCRPPGKSTCGTTRRGGKCGFNSGTAGSRLRNRIWRGCIMLFNPALHGVVPLAENYKWCSASWFARNASPALWQQ